MYTQLFGIQGESSKGDPEKEVWGIQIPVDTIRKWGTEMG